MASIDIATLIASIVVSVVGNGLLGNYLIQKLRNEQDARVKRLQASLERMKFVHRVQFEAEFAAMKTIWEKVVATRGAMAGLRPTGSLAPEGETDEQALALFFVRRQSFHEAVGELKDAIFNSQPFIPAELHSELFDVALMAATAEDMSVRIHEPNELNWYETGEKNLGIFMQSTDRVVALVRQRLTSLSVLPES